MEVSSIRTTDRPLCPARQWYLLLLIGLTLSRVAIAGPPLPLEQNSVGINEACLRAVQFVDADRGWAVGDQGVILATNDGGERWKLQSSGTGAALNDVQFISPNVGFVVGGWFEADTGLSRGVLLKTTNGGATWTEVENDLPALQQVRVLPGGGMIVSGDWSTNYFGKVFFSMTGNGGWQSVDSQSIADCRAVALSNDGGLIVDNERVLYRIDPSFTQTQACGYLPACQRLWMHGNFAIATDAEGTIHVSSDAGQQWRATTSPAGASQKYLHLLDASFLDTGEVWLAGAPGSEVVYVSADGTAKRFPTKQHAPLFGISFLDQFRGWAVGAYGTILVTRDGGKTWRAQRGSNKRAMVLGIARSPTTVPWPALGRESLEYGRRFAIAIEDPTSATTATIDGQYDPLMAIRAGRISAAAATVGGGEVLTWSSSDPFIKDLRAAVDAYKPSVLVLGADIDTGLRDAILKLAVEHGVERVTVASDINAAASMTFNSTAILPVAGAITGDLWRSALSIAAPHEQILERLNIAVLWDRTNATGSMSSLGEGLPVLDAQHSNAEGSRSNLQVLQARSSENVVIDRLIDLAGQTDGDPLKQQLRKLLNATPTEHRQRLLRTILDRSLQSTAPLGSIRLYVATLEMAIELYSHEGLGKWASLHYAAVVESAEWRHALWSQLEKTQDSDSQGAAPVAANRSPFERVEQEQASSGNNLQAVLGRPNIASPDQFILPAGAIEEGPVNTVSQNPVIGDFVWQMHPSVLLWKSKVGRDQLEAWDRSATVRLQQSLGAGAWSQLLQASPERRLTAQMVYRGGRLERPLLDGRLDDACWQPMADQANVACPIQLAYDGEFLFVGYRAVFSESDRRYEIEHRKRDETLDTLPRLCIELDLDRDLLTRYQFSVDAAGRTRDACDGFIQWQPRWYVATDLEGTVRTIELAIHRSDLSPLPFAPGDRWRIRARVLPAGQNVNMGRSVDPRDWYEVELR